MLLSSKVVEENGVDRTFLSAGNVTRFCLWVTLLWKAMLGIRQMDISQCTCYTKDWHGKITEDRCADASAKGNEPFNEAMF